MRVNDVINTKGSSVITARTDQSVTDLISLLNQHRIGAVVVTDDDQTVAGIAGERDVVCALGEHGPSALDRSIGEIMGRDVHTCKPDDDIADVAGAMTQYRARHVPVMEEGHFVGIVSIGDVVKGRIDQLESERGHLVNYLHGKE